MSTIRKLYRTDGSAHDLPAGQSIEALRKLIGAEALDTVMLPMLGRPLHVMLVDDEGYRKYLPVNVKATELYLAHCVPGTKFKIRGDVVIVPDEDFASAEFLRGLREEAS
jgi:hypothetical protein